MMNCALFLFVVILTTCCNAQSTIYSFKPLGPTDKMIAITFDDGPHGTLTPRLLDVLKEKDVKVTFFVMGIKAKLHPDILRRADTEGHEVANHVWDHPVLSKISRDQVHDQISRTNEAITKAIGKAPKVMRPPYGNTNKGLNEFIYKNENLNVVLWSLDTIDWKRPAPDAIIKRTMDNVKPGTVLLCHDIHPGTVEAISGMIDALRKEGYKFATVSKLIELSNSKTARNLRGAS